MSLKNCISQAAVVSLLLDYYDFTYKKAMGIKFRGLIPQYKVSNWNSLSEITLSETVCEQLSEYSRINNSSVKLLPLLSYLQQSKQETPTTILDFGCGNASADELITSVFPSISKVFLVDSDHEIKVKKGNFSDSVHILKIYESIEEASEIFGSSDITMAIHSLHHNPKESQRSILEMLVSTMTEAGRLYLFEDGWSENTSLEISNDSTVIFNKRFEELSFPEKICLFRLNDYISNNIAYGRHLDISVCHYRSLEDWIDLIDDVGLKVVKFGISGFSKFRLHGVPSLWFICEK